MPMTKGMEREPFEVCGVRSWNGFEYVAGDRGQLCGLPARYGAQFSDASGFENIKLGLCEHHASEAFLKVEAGTLVPGNPAELELMYSLHHDDWQRNLVRSSFSELVA